MEIGDYKAALRSLENSIVRARIPPARALAWRAECKFHAGDTRGARRDFNSALRAAAPSVYPQRLTWRGVFHLWTGRYGRAIADFDRTLREDADNAWARGWRGAAWLLQGNRTRARRDLQSCLRRDPADHEARIWQAELLMSLRCRRPAQVELRRALEANRDPSRQWVHLNSARLAAAAGSQAALKRQWRALAAFPRMREFLEQALRLSNLDAHDFRRPRRWEMALERALRASCGLRLGPPAPFHFARLAKAQKFPWSMGRGMLNSTKYGI